MNKYRNLELTARRLDRAKHPGATCVILDGPHSAGIDPASGCERPEWLVLAADDDGYECGPVMDFVSYDQAWRAAEQLADSLGVELVDDGGPA